MAPESRAAKPRTTEYSSLSESAWLQRWPVRTAASDPQKVADQRLVHVPFGVPGGGQAAAAAVRLAFFGALAAFAGAGMVSFAL
jgi:hypothetical protein